MSLALSVLFVLGVNAQERGDWYVGTGDIANKAWTEWSINPNLGYGVADNLMVGLNVSQEDSTSSIQLDFNARYFWRDYFVYASTKGLDIENTKVGIGKMFTFHKNVYVDPKVVYDVTSKTTNLMLGVGLRFGGNKSSVY